MLRFNTGQQFKCCIACVAEVACIDQPVAGTGGYNQVVLLCCIKDGLIPLCGLPDSLRAGEYIGM